MIVAGLTQDLADLTPLLMALMAFLTALVYRNEVRQVVQRLTSFRAKRGELSLEGELANAEPPALEAAHPATAQDDEESLDERLQEGSDGAKRVARADDAASTNGSPVVGDDSPSELRRRLWTSAQNRDMDGARSIHKRLTEVVTDAEEQFQDEVRWNGLRLMYGREFTAVNALKQQSERTPDGYFARQILGVAFSVLEEPEQSAEHFLAAAEAAPDNVVRAENLRWAADELQDAGEREKAISLLSDTLRQHSGDWGDAAIGHLWMGLAELLEADEPRARAFALERVLKLQPTNARRHFDVAYTLSHADSRGHLTDAAVVHHYSRAIALNPQYAEAQNNLGVALQGIGARGLAMEAYRHAADLGNTLAVANAAYQLMQAGLLEDARTLLDEARDAQEPHKNVVRALADLAEQTQTEADQRKAHIELGRKAAAHASRCADAMLEAEAVWDGQWRLNDTEATLTTSAAEATLEWATDSGQPMRLELSVRGAAAFGFLRKASRSWVDPAKYEGWELDGEAVAILDGDAVDVLVARSSTDVESLVFHRSAPGASAI